MAQGILAGRSVPVSFQLLPTFAKFDRRLLRVGSVNLIRRDFAIFPSDIDGDVAASLKPLD